MKQVSASLYVSKWVSYIGLVFGVSLICYFLLNDYNNYYIFGSITLSIVLFCTPRISHYNSTYRSGKEFKRLGSILFIQNSVFLAFSFTAFVFGFFGKIVSDISNSVIGFFLRGKNAPIKVEAQFFRDELIDLVKVGFPLLLSGYLFTLFRIADQSIIAIKLGSEELGYYTISKLILSALPVIPTTIGVLLYPKASAKYGKTKDNRGLRPFFYKSLLLNISIVIPVCLVFYFSIPYLIQWFLPEYIPGIEAAKINVITCMTFVYIGPSIIIGVVRRNIPYICILGIVLLIFWLLPLMNSFMLDSIESIAYSRLYLSIVLSISTLLYSYYLTTLNDFKA